MNPEEIHRLLEAYLEGTIGEEEARRLSAAIRAGGDDAAAVRRELELTGLLGQAIEGTDDEAFARSLEERRRAERGEADFLRVLDRRASWRSAQRRAAARRGSHALALAAAGLLLALGAALALWGLVRRPGEEAPVQAAKPTEAAPDLQPPAPPKPAPRPAPPQPEPAPPESPAPPPAPPPPPKPEPETPPPAEEPMPLPPEPPPPPAAEPTRAIPVLAFQGVEGNVFVLNAAGRAPAQKGQEVLPGQGVVASGAAGRAALLYADGTRLDMGGETWIREFLDPGRAPAKRVILAQGTVSAEIARQPADRPMVFVTPHAEARVLGTSLRLTVEAAMTLLEVREGRVRLIRDGRTVDAGAGQYAMAGPGLPSSARPMDVSEIVLVPQEAKIVGTEWVIVRDAKSSSGLALETVQAPYKPIDHVEKRPAYTTFAFYAGADKDYCLWIRAVSLGAGDPWLRDMVTVEPHHARLSRKSPFFGEAPTNAYVIEGISNSTVYAWVGSHAEEGKADPPPLSVRFQRTGMQTLRLYGVHRSVRIDAIWLSATQKTRPAAKQLPPAEGR